MRIDVDAGKMEVLDEPTYTFGSVDNVRAYPFARNLSTDGRPLTICGVLLNGEPLVVFGDSGLTRVHQDSVVYVNGQVFIAIGDKVICFCPNPFEFRWQLEVDSVTCFGLHYSSDHDALISHGELDIVRFSEDGRVLWPALGADIFSEGFALLSGYVEAIDFNFGVYHFDYKTGELIKQP
jgi:hypothetical protein